MQWLVSLEMENDPIASCRLLNVFRRKGVRVGTLSLAAGLEGTSLVAVVESPEREIEHIFHFLRRTAGVRHVDYYRHEPSGDASILFLDAPTDASSLAQIQETFPGSRLLFASHGKYLLELPAEGGKAFASFQDAGFLSFARVRTTRNVPHAVSAVAS
jgi:acetolactate synthase regulatory subunit